MIGVSLRYLGCNGCATGVFIVLNTFKSIFTNLYLLFLRLSFLLTNHLKTTLHIFSSFLILPTFAPDTVVPPSPLPSPPSSLSYLANSSLLLSSPSLTSNSLPSLLLALRFTNKENRFETIPASGATETGNECGCENLVTVNPITPV